MPESELAVVTTRLVERLAGVTPSWFGARAAGSAHSRSHLVRELVLELAELGRQAGSGAPAGAAPHPVGVHALADQVAVLARDIGAAPALTPEIEARAACAISAGYDALWVR